MWCLGQSSNSFPQMSKPEHSRLYLWSLSPPIYFQPSSWAKTYSFPSPAHVVHSLSQIPLKLSPWFPPFSVNSCLVFQKRAPESSLQDTLLWGLHTCALAHTCTHTSLATQASCSGLTDLYFSAISPTQWYQHPIHSRQVGEVCWDPD